MDNNDAKVAATAKQAPKYGIGYLYALGAVVAGIALWVLVWKLGFVSAIVAFAMAWGVSFLYQKGAKADVDTKASIVLIAMIVLGLVVAFVAGVISDSWDAYSQLVPSASLFDSNFQEFLGNVLSSGEVWSAYGRDIAMAVLFGALGSFGIIKDLVGRNKPAGSKVPSV